MFIVVIGLAIGYETAYRNQDSFIQTVVAVLQWLGTIVAGQVIFIVIWEGAIMVMAERLKQRYREEGRQEGRAEIIKRVQAWDERRKAAEARGEPFDEPIPI